MKRLAVIAAIVLARSPRAEACWCNPPAVTVSPAGTDVPRDATIMLWVPNRYAERGKPSFVVRAVGGASIAVTAKYTGSGDTVVVELIPRQPLAATTRYEVVVTRDGEPQVVQQFTTGRASSSGVPKWKAQGLGRVRYVKPARWGAGSCIRRNANLEVAWRADDPAPERLRVGIWIGTSIDLTQPPTTYVDGVRLVEVLGDPSICKSATLTIPSDRKLRFAAKLFDVAGHASDAREITIDTTKPEVDTP